MPMKVEDLIKSSVPRVKEGAKSAVINSVKPSVSRDGRARIVCVSLTRADLDGTPKDRNKIRKYKQTVESLEPEKRLRLAYVKVSCTCDDYWATWEYALHRKGAADIKFSNGEKPIDKNPKLIPGVCKHLYRVLMGIKTSKV